MHLKKYLLTVGLLQHQNIKNEVALVDKARRKRNSGIPYHGDNFQGNLGC